jgi:N-acetylglutamate synthase-like GNAT family acetyltransferase
VTITIRDATIEDLPRVVALLAQMSLGAGDHRELPGDPLPAGYARAFAAIAADPNQRLLVAEQDGAVVGTMTLLLHANLSYQGRSIAQLESVVVDAAMRGRGIGEAMVEHAVAAARAAGAVRLQLTSNAGRKDAHRFYERLGFTASHVGFKRML